MTSFINNGYLGAEEPSNTVYYQSKDYVTTYDRDFPGTYGFNTFEIQGTLETVIDSDLQLCMAPLAEHIYQETGEQFEVYLDSYNVQYNNKTISVSYDYSIDKNNQSNSYTDGVIIQNEAQAFIDDANNITNTFMSNLLNPDTTFNYQLCSTLRDTQHILPTYQLDIIKYLQQRSDTSYVLGPDYMIIILTKDNTKFGFAIKPIIIEPACT